MSSPRALRLLAAAATVGAAGLALQRLRGTRAEVFLTPPSRPTLGLPMAPRDDSTAQLSEPRAIPTPTPEVSDQLTGATAPDPTHISAADEPNAAPTGPGADDPRPSESGWTFPAEDGSCPLGHPIKAKLRSGIYHEPGMAAYDRTRADRCYTTAETAEADGLRRAKR